MSGEYDGASHHDVDRLLEEARRENEKFMSFAKGYTAALKDEGVTFESSAEFHQHLVERYDEMEGDDVSN